ncbi:MAG: hypothetical protein KKF22_11955 [Gammaproteobacteria bacterium]|nr:hypothetical protein [Gammaproteobacteria bacterium]
MDYLALILKNTSLWELLALVVVLYFLCQPSLMKTITRIKVGELEIELQQLKVKVERSEAHIDELESELQNERRLFADFIDHFNPNASTPELAPIRSTARALARNMDDIDSLKDFLKLGTAPDELYLTAVALRERRPVKLIPDLVALLADLSADSDLGGYRLNVIWTLTSALHLSLLSAVRDGVRPMPDKDTLSLAERMLFQLERHIKVQQDRPDEPLKGIRGPIKHCQAWIKKAKELTSI